MVPAWLSGREDDVRRARRQLSANPWFTAIAAGTIGLGIGANTAIHSVVDAVLLEPLAITSRSAWSSCSSDRPVAPRADPRHTSNVPNRRSAPLVLHP